MLRITVPAVALLLAASASADVTLAPAFRDHAVLQRDKPILVTGTADPGEAVEVSFGGKTVKAVVTDKGTFVATLAASGASSEPRDLVVKGKNEIVVRDVLVGDVWLCSGQSNMEWVLGQLPEANEAAQAATDPLIRYFKTPHALAWEPGTTSGGAWTIATGEAAKGCTAIGFHFARELRKTQDVPIGILDCSWGGTRIEPWIPPSGVSKDPELAAARTSSRQRIEKSEGAEAPTAETPCAMWNAMVAPFSTLRIRGVAWYQGESNAGEAGKYRRILPLMIDAWRREFNDPALPFGIFQLASFMPYRADLASEDGWADLREAQRTAAISRNAGLIVLLDIGDANDIHPARKAEAGRRLALWARATVYGETMEFSGPTLRDSQVRGDSIVLSFDHAKGLAAAGNRPLGGFAIAGEDGKFVWADATIEGDTVVVRSKDVPSPTTVRYGWHNNPEAANLVNAAGLPASSFRTDRMAEKPAKRR